MELKELRIGNFVHHKSTISEQVNVLEVDWDFFGSDFWLKESSPIPLTPEWLERLGFEQYNEGFWRIGNSDGWFLTSDGELAKSLSESEFYIRCESVHQLQNLIYSLTGKELELKQ